MAREIKEPASVQEPDLLPAMGLFTILIPLLLTMTAFSKLAIVEINLPERSMMNMSNDVPPEPDEQALNLFGNYGPISGDRRRGGFQPTSTIKRCGLSVVSPIISSLLIPRMT